MPSYTSHHAELYDLFYEKKPYRQEAAFVHTLLQKYQQIETKNILELACGTGNHSLHLAKYNYSILATDNNKSMLRIAQRKLSSLSNVKVKYMDMLNFSKFKKPFDAVLCLFDSIGYVKSNENITNVLTNVNKYLKKKGLFIFEFWNAGAMLRSYEPFRVKEWKTGNKKFIRESKTIMRYQDQLCDVHYTIYEYQNRVLLKKTEETHTNRFFLPQEMKLFLSNSGFNIVAWYDGYSHTKKITEKSWHTVCVAQKK
jgi:ubiquinone/menaquinone biosynthesis C-methylase UbiE